MEKQEKTCPLCRNHCTEDATECEKGQEYFREEKEGAGGQPHHSRGFRGHGDHGHGHSHGEHEYGHGPHHGYSGKIPRDSLTGLFMRCGHHLRSCLHEGKNTEEIVFGCLSDEEKSELKEIITKILRSRKRT